MFLLSLFSAALFALPVAVTVGVYIAVDFQQIFNGGSYGGGPTHDGQPHTIVTETYCQKAYGIEPFPGRYIFNPNQWGDLDDKGDLCMNVTIDNGIKKDNKTAAPWSATWSYPQGQETAPVHAFPNALLQQNDTMPLQLSSMAGLSVDVSWSYALGNVAKQTTDNDALSDADMNANMAIDLFLSSDETKSTNTLDASYEVMVWLGRWGAATLPIGHLLGSQDTQIIHGTSFDLYYGSNANNQRVFTWIAQGNTTDFTGDIAPLITSLADKTGPTSTDYLGYVGFGSETYFCLKNVTFSVPKLELDVRSSA